MTQKRKRKKKKNNHTHTHTHTHAPKEYREREEVKCRERFSPLKINKENLLRNNKTRGLHNTPTKRLLNSALIKISFRNSCTCDLPGIVSNDVMIIEPQNMVAVFPASIKRKPRFE